jgi:hypothetical protein
VKYGECEKKVESIVMEILDEATESGSITFENDIERGAIRCLLKSEITEFIFNNFGLEADGNG